LIQAELRPQGPYSLRLSARLASDATRTFRDGVLDSVLAIDDRLERTSAWQRPDGAVCVDVRGADSLFDVRHPAVRWRCAPGGPGMARAARRLLGH